MHYGEYAFTTDGTVKTITPVDPTVLTIGRQGYLTELDVQRLNLHFGCGNAMLIYSRAHCPLGFTPRPVYILMWYKQKNNAYFF